MGDRRPIETASFAAIEGDFAPGPAPMLQWIAIADLVVDETYQRPLAGAGRTNVRRIAKDFCWSMFAPVVVSPIEGGKYAVVDGQHRTTAAALRGIESVPCQVVIVDAQGQAAAFRAINGQVTAMSALALHRASLAAGDPDAAALAEAAAEGGVSILPYPKHVDDLKPGETFALVAIRRALKDFDRRTVVDALRCITATPNNRPGMVCAVVVRALVGVLGEHKTWRGEALLKAAAGVNIQRELDQATVTRRERGVPVWQALSQRLAARLAAKLAPTPTAAPPTAAPAAQPAVAPRQAAPRAVTPPSPAAGTAAKPTGGGCARRQDRRRSLPRAQGGHRLPRRRRLPDRRKADVARRDAAPGQQVPRPKRPARGHRLGPVVT